MEAMDDSSQVNLKAKKKTSKGSMWSLSEPSQEYSGTKRSLSWKFFRAVSEPSQAQVEATRRSSQECLEAFSGPSQTQLETGKSPSSVHFGDFSEPSQACIDTESSPTQEDSRAFSESSRAHLEVMRKPFQKGLAFSGPSQTQLETGKSPSSVHFGNFSEPSQACIDTESSPTQEDSRAFSESSRAHLEAMRKPFQKGLAFSGPSQELLEARRVLSQEHLVDFAGPSWTYLEARRNLPQKGLVACAGPSQVHLEARKALSQESLAFAGPSQARLESRREPPQEGLRAYSKSFEADLWTWHGPPRAELSLCPDYQRQAQGSSLEYLEKVPDDKTGSSLIISGASAGLVEGNKISLPLSTRSQQQPKESLGTAQTGSSANQEAGKNQSEMFQANFPSREKKEKSSDTKMRTEFLSPLRVEEPPSILSQIKRFFQRKKTKEVTFSPSPKDLHHSQCQESQSLTEEIHTESPISEKLRTRQLLLGQGNSSTKFQLSRSEEEELRFFFSNVKYEYFNDRGVVLNIMSNTETGLIKPGKRLYICDQFLMNKCKKGKNCPGYHTLLPFHWQFLHEEDDSWHSIPIGSQLHLEMVYTHPSRRMAMISFGNNKITFIHMVKKLFPKAAPFKSARRITCEENSLFPPTTVFYWSEDNENWTPYNEHLQSLIRNSNKRLMKLVSTKDNTEVIINLDNLTQIKDGILQSVAYRPAYTPFYELVSKLRIWHVEQPNDFLLCGEEATDEYLGPYPGKNIVTIVKGKESFTLMEILPSDISYQKCCKHFYFSMDPHNAVVLRVFRLYNPLLWEQYKRQKIMMSNSIERTGSTHLEYHLFHQTTMKMEEVAFNGLDPETNRSNGSLGNGIYFSLSAVTTATMNANQAPDFGYVMVLAKVLIGRKALGKQGILAPPFNGNGQQYDCCVNDLQMPTLFAIFDKKYIYPYFIILYKLRRNPIHLAF